MRITVKDSCLKGVGLQWFKITDLLKAVSELVSLCKDLKDNGLYLILFF